MGTETRRCDVGQVMHILCVNGDNISWQYKLIIIPLTVQNFILHTAILVTHMNTMAPFTLNWGIISTGGISTTFAHDLLVDPSSRNTRDVNHKIAAVGSRSIQSAQAFIDQLMDSSEGKSWAWGVKNGVLDGVKARGTYEEVYNDPVRILGLSYYDKAY